MLEREREKNSEACCEIFSSITFHPEHTVRGEIRIQHHHNNNMDEFIPEFFDIEVRRERRMSDK
jgi:hypothetical protein